MEIKKFVITAVGILVCFLASTVYASSGDLPEYSQRYDPKRDPFYDLKLAKTKAKKENKKILVEIGGDWCKWCHHLDRFLVNNPQIRKELLATFVLLKVNFSDKNKNEQFISFLPAFSGFPHFVILDNDGNILGAQNTAILEDGEGYSGRAFLKFIRRWQKAENN